MMNLVRGRNCIYQTSYHVVWCTKYRKAILVGEVAMRLKRLIIMICKENKWVIIAKEIQPDHVHLFFSIPPAISLADTIKKLKGITARKLFIQFPELKDNLWGGSLWSPSYYVGTAGHVSAETIQSYIERTEHSKGRR